MQGRVREAQKEDSEEGKMALTSSDQRSSQGQGDMDNRSSGKMFLGKVGRTSWRVQFEWGVIFFKKVMGSKVLYFYLHPTSLSLGLVPPLAIEKQ